MLYIILHTNNNIFIYYMINYYQSQMVELSTLSAGYIDMPVGGVIESFIQFV